MFDLTHKLPDNIKDDVRPFLDALVDRKGWNGATKSALSELKKILKKMKYKAFVGHPSRYHLTRIGASCLYDVPADRKGVLSLFRGKRVRIVCVSSGRFDRLLMAGVVGVTPAHLLRSRDKPNYVFPEVGDHEIAYLGRRYMLIKSTGTTAIELHQGSFQVVDSITCDYILLDGKECCPIATLKYENDEDLVGTLIGWSHGERFASIADAIRGMAKKSERFKVAVFR